MSRSRALVVVTVAKTLDPIRWHELTKNSPFTASGAWLDWRNQPRVYKDYLDLEPLSLPDPEDGASALLGSPTDAAHLDLSELARVLVFGAGVLRTKRYTGGERFEFRAYACAGALYPVEVYIACRDVEGLDAGLYHFHPRERTLRRLRDEDPVPYLVRACGGRAVGQVNLVLSGIAWRTTWKYGPRGYRHLFWDSGTMTANILALAAAHGHDSEVRLGFVDAEVNALLGIDGRREAATAIVSLGPTIEAIGATDQAPPVEHRVASLSRGQRDYEEVFAVHGATSIETAEQAASWGRPIPEPRKEAASRFSDGIEKAIRARKSTRSFDRASIPSDRFDEIVDQARAELASDWPGVVEVVGIVNAVEGLQPGAYSFGDRQAKLMRAGDFRREAQWLCLDQPAARHSACTLFCLCDLIATTAVLGPRGYRAAQLEAGIRMGRAHLAAYADGVGATGLTFFDDEVRKFFGTASEPMLATAIGMPKR